MARSFGGKLLAPMVVADVTELGGTSLLFNWLSVIIDVAPLCVLVVISDFKDARKYFTEKAFAAGAIMNLMIMVHVLFCTEEEHPDVLLVSTVGFFLGSAYTFFLLLHRVATNDTTCNARFWMLVVLVCFISACFAMLGALLEHYKSNKSSGRSIAGLLFLAVATLNAFTLYPIITCKPFPDQEAKFHSWFMCILNFTDSVFFVYYAKEVKSSDPVLAIMSMINAACGGIQLMALVVVVLARCFRRLGAWFRSCGETCCGVCRVISMLFYLFGPHAD